MKFQVPQFTDVEDKIIGPLSFKQFIYLGGSAGACLILYAFLPKIVAFPFMLPVIALGLALAFYKYNNRPFIKVVESFVKYFLTSKLYIWKQEFKKPVSQQNKPSVSSAQVPKLSESKLRDLMWTLDVKENANPVTKNDE